MSMLFAKPPSALPNGQEFDLNTIKQTPSNNLGYILFPAEGQRSTYDRLIERKQKVQALKEERKVQEEEEKQKATEEAETRWAARQEKELEARMERLKLEEEEARIGEESWVRSGGVLRTKDGKRDWERTRKVKAELDLRDKEDALVKRWAEYEARWKTLLSSKPPSDEAEEDLEFADIPWPIPPRQPITTPKYPKIEITMTKAKPKQSDPTPDINLFSITPASVESFLLADLSVRNRPVTRKDRIRASMLRWHPDKLTSIRRRVVERDRESVEQGIKVVFGVLSRLNNAESLERSVRK